MFGRIFLLLILFAIICAGIYLQRRRRIIGGKYDTFGGRQSRRSHTERRAKTIYKDLNKHPRTKSEALVITILERITGRKFPTAFPEFMRWRGKILELDGYNDELKLALEFSGPLHTKWLTTFEPYSRYFERIVKDRTKLLLCAKASVRLIVIDMTLPRHHIENYLKSRLFDYGMGEMPTNYIAQQTAIPYRHSQLEEAEGLKMPPELETVPQF